MQNPLYLLRTHCTLLRIHLNASTRVFCASSSSSVMYSNNTRTVVCVFWPSTPFYIKLFDKDTACGQKIRRGSGMQSSLRLLYFIGLNIIWIYLLKSIKKVYMYCKNLYTLFSKT